MKKLIYILFAIALIYSCKKEDSVKFDATVSEQNISFKPISGGAVMYYQLPDNNQVMGIKVRYTDAQGKDVTCVGSYLCDSLVLVGFNEAQRGIEAKLTLSNRQEVESEPISVTFDTKASGAASFFENAEISPYWYGFQVKYSTPEGANGMGHIFYIGIDPVSHRQDTIFLESFQIKQGADTLHYILQQKSDFNNIIIRTEDYRGYTVNEHTWKDVQSYNMAQIDNSKFTFDTGGLSIEDPDREFSAKYLFDGDVKGDAMWLNRKDTKYFTFMAGPRAKGAPFIYEFKDAVVPAQLRIYGALSVRTYSAREDPIWEGDYNTKVPSTINVYVSNDRNDDNSWKLLGSYSEAKDLMPTSLRWSYRVRHYDIANHIRTQEVFDAAKPCFTTIYFPASSESWKYMKLVFEETSSSIMPNESSNPAGYVTLHELELQVKSN